MENLIAMAGNFFAKHTMLYAIALLAALSTGVNVGYVKKNYVQAGDFQQFVNTYQQDQWQYALDRLRDRKYKLNDDISELKRRIEKGIQTETDLERLRNKINELSVLEDRIKDHESNRP